MKKSLVAITAITVLMGSRAFAADLALKAPPPPPPSWTGCYVSAGVGYGMLDDERSGSDPTRPSSTSAAKGWLGAFGGGCDYQFNGSPIGPIVVGAFADYDLMGISGNFGDPFNSGHYGTQTEQGAWYVGARAGVLITPTLLSYIDGGGTGAQIGRIGILTTAGAPVLGGLYLPSESPGGWFIGGGAEYALTFVPINGLFWKTEYRFASYDSYNQNYIHPPAGLPGTSSVHNSVDTQTITSSLVWRFNWTGH